MRRALAALLAAWCCAGIACAQDVPGTVALVAGQDGPSDLFPYIGFKPIGKADSIPLAIAEGDFQSLADKRTGFGRADSPLLLVLDVVNTSDQPGTWVLSTGKVVLRTMEFCQLRDGAVLRCIDALAAEDRVARLRRYHAHALELTLAPGERQTIAMRYQASNISVLFPSLKTAMGHQRELGRNLLITAIATTAFLVLIVVNACLYLLIRNTVFGYFVLAELAFLYNSLYLVNYTTIYLFPNNYPLSAFVYGLAVLCFSAFSIRFAQVFLGLQQHLPRLNRFFNGFLWVTAAFLAASLVRELIPFVSTRNMVFGSILVSNVVCLILPILGVWSVWRLGWYYVPLMLSWLILGGIAVFYTLSAMSLVEGAHEIRHWYGMFGFAQGMFISISIALSIRLLQNRERDAQAQLQHELREKLTLVEAANTLTVRRNLALTELAEKGRLLLSAGHDAKSFLGALRHLTASIKSDAKDARQREIVRDVSEAEGLLNRTLSVIMYSSNTGPSRDDTLALELVDIDRLFGALDLVHGRSAIDEGLTLRFASTVSALPGDRTLMTRVLSNFISNAIRYSDSGRILAVARSRGTSVVFRVHDQGPGIAADALGQIMDPAQERQRLDGTVTGEGVGLTIAAAMARQMGGRISARSTVGRGSYFELELPAMAFPDASVTCAVAPSDLLAPEVLETVRELVAVRVAGEPSAEPDGADVHLMRASTYAELEQAGRLPPPRRIALVTDDRSMAFRDQWCDRVGLVVYTPVDESLVLIALSRLQQLAEE